MSQHSSRILLAVFYIVAVAAVPLVASSQFSFQQPEAVSPHVQPRIVDSLHANPERAVPFHDGRNYGQGATLRGDAPGFQTSLPRHAYPMRHDEEAGEVGYGPLRGGGWWQDGPWRRMVSAPVRFLFRRCRC